MTSRDPARRSLAGSDAICGGARRWRARGARGRPRSCGVRHAGPRPRRAGSDRRGCKPCAHGRASARARPRLLARRPLRFAVAARRAAPRMHVSSHINRKVKPLSHQSCVKTPHLTLARLMRRTSPTHSRLRQSHGTAPRGHRGKRPGSRPQRTGDAATAACRALLPLLKNEGQGQAGGEELCRGLS